jgi:hypothetical protein
VVTGITINIGIIATTAIGGHMGTGRGTMAATAMGATGMSIMEMGVVVTGVVVMEMAAMATS